jgi:NAD(P)-dependent dehydrogenase (short-subunit alcohol dehydrogenase family)
MTATRQVALVTGASSGIGKAAAIALAGAGFEVMGTARNTARVTAPAGVRPRASAHYTASSPPGSSTALSADSTGCRADAPVRAAGHGCKACQPLVPASSVSRMR